MAKPRKRQLNAVIDEPIAELWDEMAAPYSERTKSRVVIGALLVWAQLSREERDEYVRIIAQAQAVSNQRIVDLVKQAKSGNLRKLVKRMIEVFDSEMKK